MERNYTLGPWMAEPKEQYYNGSGNTFEVNFGNDGECICEVVHGIENAHLISAAPDLLEALELLLAQAPDTSLMDGLELSGRSLIEAVSKAKEAIAKALGKEVEND